MTLKSLGNRVVSVGLLHLMLLLLVGCATKAGTSTASLLERDHRPMGNAELTAYEQELSDQINLSSASGSGGASIGFGFGSWGSHSGVGIGVDQPLGGGSDPASGLRARRDAVRMEMRKRGLLPSSPGAAVPSRVDSFFS